MIQPTWDICTAKGCYTRVYDSGSPYCDSHVPITSWVNAAQVRKAKGWLKNGMPLYHAAKLVGADVRDLDVALWSSIGGHVERV